MTLSSITALFGAMTILAIVPGPGSLTVVGRSLSAGFYHGLLTSLGIVCAHFLFIAIYAFGSSSIGHSLHGMFTGLKFIGVAYLFWLATKYFRKYDGVTTPGDSVPRGACWQHNWVSGFFVTISNPASIVFYLTLLPSIVHTANPSVSELLILMAVATAAIGGVMACYAYSASRAKKRFSAPNGNPKWRFFAGCIMLIAAIVLLISI